MLRFTLVLVAIAGVASAGAVIGAETTRGTWSAEERATIASLSLASLEALPKDPSNRFADDTLAQRLGRALFFDERLSSDGTVSCGKCHLPDRDFQDDVALARGVGTTARRTMPIAGTAHSPWLFWDGRADRQWSQALGPLESPVEHGGTRTQYAQYIARAYRQDYERLFGQLPDLTGLPAQAGPNGDSAAKAAWAALSAERREQITRVYVNMGKAIAAFERTVAFPETRFDRYVRAQLAGTPDADADRFTPDEAAGLRLFIGKASCVNCHNGARLTDDAFHNTGVAVSPLVSAPDSGRSVGVRDVMAAEFNCTSPYSDAKPEECGELRFAVTQGAELVRAFKTPSLRNVSDRAPFMHAGQIETLGDVIAHYDRAPKAPFGKSELKRLRLSPAERRQLEAFLNTLSGPATMPAETKP